MRTDIKEPETTQNPLPEDWQEVRLGEVAEIEMGQSPPSISYNHEGIGLPFFQGKADFGDIHPITRKWCSSPSKIAEKDDLLLSVRAPIGAVNIALQRCCIGRGLAAIRVNSNLESKYIFYRLLFSKELLESKGTGTTFKQINKETVVTFLIPLPPLPEQRAIAHVLRTIQRAIEATERVIAAARELKKSLMRHLFTYGPVPPAEAESVPLKETEIGPLPVHWQVVRLGEVTEKTHQIDPRRRPDWRFKYVDVSAISSELLRIQYYSEYLGKDAPHRARKVVKANDVIFATIRPCLKRIAIVPDSLDGHIASTAFCVVRCKPDLADSHFIFSAVSTDGFVERVSANQRGSSYPAVTDKNVLQQYIPLPPLSEQQRIAEILQVVDAKIQAEENRKAALQSLFKSMLHRLMTGKVRLSWEFITRLKEDR